MVLEIYPSLTPDEQAKSIELLTQRPAWAKSLFKEIADKNDGLFVDQFHPYLAVLEKARGASPKYSRITAGDAVHPGFPGQALMAGLKCEVTASPTKCASTP